MMMTERGTFCENAAPFNRWPALSIDATCSRSLCCGRWKSVRLLLVAPFASKGPHFLCPCHFSLGVSRVFGCIGKGNYFFQKKWFAFLRPLLSNSCYIDDSPRQALANENIEENLFSFHGQNLPNLFFESVWLDLVGGGGGAPDIESNQIYDVCILRFLVATSRLVVKLFVGASRRKLWSAFRRGNDDMTTNFLRLPPPPPPSPFLARGKREDFI